MKDRKIKFYKERTFSEKFDDTFAFIRQNFRILMKYSCYTFLPFAMLAGFGINSMIDLTETYGRVSNASFDNEQILPLLLSCACVLPIYIGYLLFHDVVYSLIQLYNERENGLVDAEWVDIKPYFTKNLGKLIVFGITFVIILFVIALAMGGLAVVATPTLFITIPAFIVLLICMVQWLAVYVYDERNIFDALTTSIRYGWNTFGGMLGLGIVMTIIGYIVSSIISVPWSVLMFVKAYLSTQEANIALSDNFVFQIFYYVFAVLYLFGSSLVSILSIVAISYQYAHSAEKLDGISIDDDIERFEEIVSEPEDTHQPVIIRDDREDARRFMPHSDIDNFENL